MKKIIPLTIFLTLSGSFINISADENLDNYEVSQWGLVALQAEKSWEISTGEGVIIAVLDTGIDGTHRDLKDVILDGYSTVDNKEIAKNTNSDIMGHGTHVAGIIAANKNNSGITGLAYNAKILPIKVLSNDGGSDENVADGINYAVKNGARVINLSLGGTINPFGSGAKKSCEAIEDAYNKNVVVVVSSGNSGGYGNPKNEPASCKYAISVAAVDEELNKTEFSSYDSSLSFVAPGRRIISTVPESYNKLGYAVWDGTSMAAPFVSATVALLIAKNPTITVDEIIYILKKSAIDLTAKGYDPITGYGLINPITALAGQSLPLSDLKNKIINYATPNIKFAKYDGYKLDFEWEFIGGDVVELNFISNLEKITISKPNYKESIPIRNLPNSFKISILYKNKVRESIYFNNIEDISPIERKIIEVSRISNLKASWTKEGIDINWVNKNGNSLLSLFLTDYTSQFFIYKYVDSKNQRIKIPIDLISETRSNNISIFLSNSKNSLEYNLKPEYYITFKIKKAGEKFIAITGSTSNLCINKKMGCKGSIINLLDYKSKKNIASNYIFEHMKFDFNVPKNKLLNDELIVSIGKYTSQVKNINIGVSS